MSAADDAAGDRALLRGALLDARRATLVSGPGQVRSARDFARARTDGLRPEERQFLVERLELLSDELPPPLRAPWRLASAASPEPGEPQVRTEGRGLAPAGAGPESPPRFTVDGARSAYLPEHGIQLKACRPVDDPRLGFIGEDVDVETGGLVFSRLPFGVLRAEGALRELLAWVFLHDAGLEALRRPLAVIDYGDERFGLALEAPPHPRVESMLAYPRGSLDDLLAAALVRRRFGEAAPGEGEVELVGVERPRYVEAKARALARWHLAGGFRGILNSNIGNEVWLGDDRVALTDLDTFQLLPPPLSGDVAGLSAFVLRALLEAVRSSLPIAALALEGEPSGPLYLRFSSGFAAYRAALRVGLSGLGFGDGALQDAEARALATEAFEELAADQVVSWRHLTRSYAPAESLYVPHGARE